MSILTEDLEEYDTELKTICGDIQKEVQAVDKSEVDSQDRVSVRKLQTRLTEAKMVNSLLNQLITQQLLRSFKLELKSKPEEEEKYKEKSKYYAECVETASKKLEAYNKGDFKQGHQPDASTDQILVAAAGVQQESLQKLDDMIVLIEDSKNVGTQSASALAGQNEQLEETKSGIQVVQTALKLSSKLLRGFRRRLVSDKILQVLLLIIVLGIIGIIIVKSVFPSVKFKDVFQ